jgi:DNA-binding MarR family transcriptional regulator
LPGEKCSQLEKSSRKGVGKIIDEATLKKITLLKMESDSLNNILFKRAFQDKISTKFKELSKNQPIVIKIIGLEGEVMPSTIGKYTGMEKSSLTRMIDDLENKGIVYRKNDPEDRRKILISLTNEGINYYNYLTKITDEMVAEVLKYIDEKDVMDYLQSLETMIRILRLIDSHMNRSIC